jgi:tetratricopeptide (TPR) repeat protein
MGRAAGIARRLGFGLALLALGACGGPSPSRLLVVGIDGLDPEEVEKLIAEGELPNFARLRTDGVFLRMDTPKPLLSPIIWTTLATGHEPLRHGIGHFTTVDPESGRELPVTSSLRKVKALWNLFSERGRKVGVIGWWATWPAEAVDGVVVSDHAGYHFLLAEDGKAQEADTVYPPERSVEILARLRRPEQVGLAELDGMAKVDATDLARPFVFDDELSHLRWAVATALSYQDLALEIWRRDRPELLMVYFEGVDSISHLFGHLHRRNDLHGELRAQQERYGDAVRGAYRLADRLVGELMTAMDEETTLVVMSDHGFQLGVLPEDSSTTRDLRRVSEEFHRVPASLFFYGRNVRRGATAEGTRTLDVTPTLLALAGLPVADDMPGRVLEEVLELPARERIVSWEDGRRAQGAAARSQDVDQAVLERLRSLGYIGGAKPSKSDRNIAALLLQQGDYRSAARAYKELSDGQPDDPAMKTGLATALAGLDRREEALAAFGAALAIDPLYGPAYFNRGLLRERTGERATAVEDYRAALRVDRTYEPAIRALERLGEGQAGRAASTGAEVRADELLRQARELAKAGDLTGAERLLVEAEALAPTAAVVRQYRANVAYLRGDLAAAVEHLRRAVELAPTDAALRENLRRLERKQGAPKPPP